MDKHFNFVYLHHCFGSCDPLGAGGQLGRLGFFFFVLAFSTFPIHVFLTLSVSFNKFHSCYSQAQVFGKTLVHECMS